MTKAERIYKATKSEIMGYVRKGTQFDCLTHLVYDENDIICKRTVNDIKKLAMKDFERLQRVESRYERRPEEAERYPALLRNYQDEVETMRRVWLTIMEHV